MKVIPHQLLPRLTGEVAAGRRGKASVEAPTHLRTMQCLEDGFDDGVGSRQHVTIPETQDPKAGRSQDSVTVGIVGRVQDVLAAVDLDDDRCLETDEVADEPAYRVLPTELEAAELAPPKATPEPSLGFGRVVAKVLSIGFHAGSWPGF